MNIIMRKAQPGDVDIVARLYDELNDHLSAHTNYPGWRKGIYPTVTEAQHFFETGTLYVAEADSQVVGSMALTHEPEPENANWLVQADDEHIFVIHVFVVHPACLRRGIAGKMLQFAEDQAVREGVQSIRLDVYEKNLAAINAYEKAGYQYIDKVDLGLGQYGLDWFCLYEKPVDRIALMKPTMEYADEIMSYRQDLLDAGGGFAGCFSLRNCETAEEWIRSVELSETTAPEGFVTCSSYLAVRPSDHKVVGIIDLRHSIDHPILGTWGGHIGYSVRPSERRKGYASEMLRQNLINCCERGLEKVLITCDADNIASEKTIIKNGGVFEKAIEVDGKQTKRYWVACV